MKRTNNPNEWTDGKNIYVGNPRDGFQKKGGQQTPKKVVEVQEQVVLSPVEKTEEKPVDNAEE